VETQWQNQHVAALNAAGDLAVIAKRLDNSNRYKPEKVMDLK